jgi:mannonate dehydratase
MRFDLADFAAFDVHVLKRRAAADDYPSEVRDEAAGRFAAMDADRQEKLAANIAYGLPGAAELTL